MTGTALLQLSGITKRFPGVLANDNVGFSIAPGAIHALLGENGAGKSTLVKMIYGVMRPDQGEMRFDGAPYAPARPSEARACGVGMVFQHFSLFEALSVAENVALGMNKEAVGKDLNRQITEGSESYGGGAENQLKLARIAVEQAKMEIANHMRNGERYYNARMYGNAIREFERAKYKIVSIPHDVPELKGLLPRVKSRISSARDAKR